MDRLIDADTAQMFFAVDSLQDDEAIKSVVKQCCEAQKAIGEKRNARSWQPDPNALSSVSANALTRILHVNEDISDIRTHTEISNCVVFHTRNLEGSLLDDSVLELRKQADSIVMQGIQALFRNAEDVSVEVSGHFWYPPGGFMGWHTNLRKPGWRMYVTYCEEADQSFFRYRDPDTGKTVTCDDHYWNFRLFKISPEKPFWHCVYSNTNRFSLGYRIVLRDHY